MVTCRLRVIFGDTDSMGVVYHANYLRYFESGRNELIRSRGYTYRQMEERGLGLPVVRVEARYLAPAVYDDLLDVETEVVELRRASVRFGYRIRRSADGAVLCEGETHHACVDGQRRPTGVPPDLRMVLGRREAL